MGAAGIVSFLQLGITCVATLMFFALNSTAFTSVLAEDDICQTKPCKDVRNLFESHVDQYLDPCQNFSKFVCDGYIQQHIINQTFGSEFKDYLTKADEIFRNLISAPPSANDRDIIRFSKFYFNSCMNKDFFASNMYQAVSKQLLNIGLWPLISNYSSVEGRNWTDLYRDAYYVGLPLNSVVNVDITYEDDNLRDFSVHLKKGNVTENTDENKEYYKKIMLDIIKASGVEPAPDSDKQFEEMFDFQNKFAAIVSQESTEKDSFKTIEELESSCPDVDWLKLSNIAFQPEVFLKRHEKIHIFDEKLICESVKLTKNNEEATYNHIFLRLALGFIELFNKYKKISEFSEYEHRKQCALVVLDDFTIGATAYYMDNRHNELGSDDEYRKYISNLVYGEIKEEYKIIIGNENQWLDDKTRQALLEKIDSIKFHIGYYEVNSSYSDQFLALENIYKDAEISDTDILQNYVQIKKFHLRKFGSERTIPPIFLSRDGVLPDAHYSVRNIYITYTLLTEIFHYMGPNFMNYGGLAHTIGHEFGHSLDNYFHMYGTQDKLEDFWSESNEKEFQQRMKCLVDTYNKEWDSCAEKYIDGEKTKNENLADLLGINVARRIYEKKLSESNNEDYKIDGFTKYTPQQMFWMSTAFVYCSRPPKEECVFLAENDVHTRGAIRINMNAKMSPYFAQDFNCPENSPMNPSSRCEVY